MQRRQARETLMLLGGPPLLAVCEVCAGRSGRWVVSDHALSFLPRAQEWQIVRAIPRTLHVFFDLQLEVRLHWRAHGRRARRSLTRPRPLSETGSAAPAERARTDMPEQDSIAGGLRVRRRPRR